MMHNLESRKPNKPNYFFNIHKTNCYQNANKILVSFMYYVIPHKLIPVSSDLNPSFITFHNLRLSTHFPIYFSGCTNKY